MTPDDITALALTGYGHFTTMRVEDGAVRGLGLHLDRLARDCRTLFGTGLDRRAVRGQVRDAVGGRPGTVVVRVTVFDPALSLADPAGARAPRTLVTTRPAPALPPGPMRVRPVEHRRGVPQVKGVGLFDSLYLRRQAQLAGFDDALFTAGEEGIAEGATWNIGFFDGNSVVWPDAAHLPGVTMALLDRAHGRCRTAPVGLAELPSMRAAFATNAAVGVRPVSAVGDVAFPADHPVLAELRSVYGRIAPEPV